MRRRGEKEREREKSVCEGLLISPLTIKGAEKSFGRGEDGGREI